MNFIRNQRSLDEAITSMLKHKDLYLDTEFYRRTTYFAKLCLIQISTKSENFVIDAFAPIDLSPIKQILISEDITKVMHSSDQDLQIFYNKFGILPKNFFDTQIAAEMLGFGKNVGYGTLCHELIGIKINKKHQKADWQQRPLPEELLEYAVFDTKYLVLIYPKLLDMLKAQNITDSFKERMNKYLQKSNIITTSEKLYQRMRVGEVSPFLKHAIVELIGLREEIAQSINIPRNFLIHDIELIQIARKLPKTAFEVELIVKSNKILKEHNVSSKIADLCLAMKSLM